MPPLKSPLPDIEAEPVDPEPAAGDTVIELRDGVPYIYTHPAKEGSE